MLSPKLLDCPARLLARAETQATDLVCPRQPMAHGESSCLHQGGGFLWNACQQAPNAPVLRTAHPPS